MDAGDISSNDFDFLMIKLREFFHQEGLKEACVQHRRSILAACEDPNTISIYSHGGKVWPLPQTGQMQLELEMLRDPTAKGFFTISTSYRNEPSPIEGRHQSIFSMAEVEIDTDIKGLIDFEMRMLKHLGFDLELVMKEDWIPMARALNCSDKDDIGHEEEQKIWKLWSPIFFLCNFPLKTSPFWNMKLDGIDKGIAKKVDVILYGMETIGSAERSCNPEEMRNLFHTISNGKYAERLYSEFSKERVDKELDEYLSYKFRTRSGFGMGLTRLIRAMKLANLLPE
uniref:Aspartyl/asparaginyl-tRNA synthetase n=1 Tax=Marseillevirus LCMAC101 TaxID=2506602 RepID=A0A481YRA6_9VIRU|nr:MAG: aspartyl/asparaginyl-tRNA synthetase [Marseillevirus LCMAC101]